MSFFLLAIFIIISYIIVKVGSVALELTGLSREVARFQALSAFSSTGFTTRESEMIVHHPRRRKIISYLIILGNAGIVSVIASFVVSFGKGGVISPALSILLVFFAVGGIWFFSKQKRLTDKLHKYVRKRLLEKAKLEDTNVEEVLNQSGDYGLVKIFVSPESELVGQKIAETHVREKDIIILSIQNADGITPNPKATHVIAANSTLICYGRLSGFEQVTKY